MLTGKHSLRRRIWAACMRGLMYLSAGVTAALALVLVAYVLIKGIPHITWDFLTGKPSYLNDTIGILPDILNTLYVVLATLAVVLPLGVGAAVYLTEYAANRRLAGAIEYAA